MFQRTRFKIIIYALLLLIGLSIFAWWVLFNFARGRDYERLGDMKAIQAQMTAYFGEFNTFILPNCQPTFLISQCGAKTKLADFSLFRDPLNAGNYRYIVSQLSESDFGINFTLETTIAGLAPGTYTMTKTGIRK